MSKEKRDIGQPDILQKYCGSMSRRKRKILIVDDDEVSCAVLGNILQSCYDIITAGNGKEALDILKKRKNDISLILLDLIMPVMDGYEFLDIMMADPHFSTIPVIVTTVKEQEEDEIRSMKKGAADFVTKPYRPEIVRCRVERIIHLRETAAVLNVIERDRLTGLYSRETFYMEVQRILEEDPDGKYDLVVADAENFKVVNERLGVKIGDKVLCYMAERYQRNIGNHGICTRMHGDVFAMLIPHGDGSWKEKLLWQWDEEVDGIPLRNLVIKYGVYENVSRKIDSYAMCDRAILALNRIKNRYGKYVSMYDDSLRATLLREQQILDTMELALKERQFQVYYQPKYDIESNHISGAEALVRWIHPELGFMSPGEFIPLFEKNGFISKLDYYVWEETCKNLRKWKDEGHRSISVSVNISRRDFDEPDLAEQIIDLTEKYGIDRELLHLEITESVYTDEPEYIVRTVKRLRDSGFKIEMDDFGSGYSSLNMLSELSIDVLKLDMKFVQSSSRDRKSILGFVISLAKWLNLATIAEGVENEEQVEKLRSLGCDYVQGFYYAKPMPLQEFERYLEKDSNQDEKKREDQTGRGSLMPEEREKRPYKVLIVEDSEMNREILRSMLEPYYYIEEASNGKEAYDYLCGHFGEISIILLDLVMPVMDGFQFMKLRSRDERLSDIPVIIISESHEDGDLMALRVGADYFAGKPYKKELVLRAIETTIERWKWKNSNEY